MKIYGSVVPVSLPWSLISLLCFVEYASSIFCYDCNSAFDPRCGEEFDPFSLGVVNCSLKDPLEHIETNEATLCRTIKMEIYGKVRVVRQCGYLEEEKKEGQEEPRPPCRRQPGLAGDLFVTYCSCSTDLCNTSPPRQQMALAITTVASFMLRLV